MHLPTSFPFIRRRHALAVGLAGSLPTPAEAAALVVTHASVHLHPLHQHPGGGERRRTGRLDRDRRRDLHRAGLHHHAGLHLRGMDRNAVILDGQHQTGNGIEVWKASGVSIENLTVHDFDRPSLDGANGNEIWLGTAATAPG